MNVIPVSGYRSYSQQASLYDSYVHLRYAGKALALDMQTRQMATLEQYVELEAAPDYLP